MLKRRTENAIISLDPTYIDAFLSGNKCVELRRRAPSLEVGAWVWFYGKVPYGKIMAVGVLRSIVTECPEEIWNKYSRCIALDRDKFDQYLAGRKYATALSFEKVIPLNKPIDLIQLRTAQPNFQPPQFFKRLSEGELLDQLSRAALRANRLTCKHS